MSIENLKALLEQELKDIYHAEGQVLKSLPKLIRAAQEAELKDALEGHLEETQKQKQRLEQCFQELGMAAKGKPCEGMKGIIEEGDEMLDEAGDAVMDAAIIAAAQKVEHYEIASYGCARTWAATLGHDRVAELLEETLEEEKAADVRLTELAVTCANRIAEQGDEGDEDREGSEGEEGEESEEKTTARKPAKQPARRRDRAAKATR